jgi:hypothetical protein
MHTIRFINNLQKYSKHNHIIPSKTAMNAVYNHTFQHFYPFNAGINSLRATLPDEIFTGDFVP